MIIYKYVLDIVGIALGIPREIEMPRDARILTVHEQSGCICLWALVDDNQPKETRVFTIHGTGWPLPEAPSVYIGTAFVDAFVWHVFEQIARKDQEVAYSEDQRAVLEAAKVHRQRVDAMVEDMKHQSDLRYGAAIVIGRAA